MLQQVYAAEMSEEESFMIRDVIPLGRVRGIEIGLDYSLFIIFVVLTWMFAESTTLMKSSIGRLYCTGSRGPRRQFRFPETAPGRLRLRPRRMSAEVAVDELHRDGAGKLRRRQQQRNAITRLDHTNSGISCMVMPGARMFKMVVMKLMAPKIDHAPARCSDRIAKSIAARDGHRSNAAHRPSSRRRSRRARPRQENEITSNLIEARKQPERDIVHARERHVRRPEQTLSLASDPHLLRTLLDARSVVRNRANIGAMSNLGSTVIPDRARERDHG